ncbi:MAG TPA: hypothetical protein HPQ03_16295 [Deltaproteobacteria bacterium]|nr:hypothetical protein [Deltaproteobacteria bacterium]
MRKQGPSSNPDAIKRAGYRLFLSGICALLAGLAIPLVLVFLIRSPQPEQHLIILGISYYKLVFILFLSSAILVHTSLFFIKTKPVIILFLFCLFLFCCFPFIVGLKNNLTLSQAIVDMPFFTDWPIFLNPGYVLIEFLIPSGVIVYLYLQIRKSIARRPHHYAFLCVAIYLSVAAFLGLSGLAQARQPTIGSAIAGFFDIDPVQNGIDMLIQNTSPDSTQASVARFPIPPIPVDAEEIHRDPQTAPEPAGAENIPDQLLRLSERMDGLKSHLDVMEGSLLKKQGTEQIRVEEKERNRFSKDKETIAHLQLEMQRLSDKIDTISSTLTSMARLLTAEGTLNEHETEPSGNRFEPKKSRPTD